MRCMTRFLEETPLLDYSDPTLARLVQDRGWRALPYEGRVRAVYDFVRDEVAFGYNESDDLPASRVLRDGLGQCNTKATLLMALLRAVNVPCRLHGFTVHKELQRGLVPELFYRLAPGEILHSWVEVPDGEDDLRTWVHLEGFIVDGAYLRSLQRAFRGCGAEFCGFAVSTHQFQSPPVEYSGADTYIQRDAIARDLGTFDAPDDFYRVHGANLRGWRALLFRGVVRKMMNRRVRAMREGAEDEIGPRRRDERFLHRHERA